MVPKDHEGKFWTDANANMVLRAIHRDAAKLFLERDIANGLPNDGKVYRIVNGNGQSCDAKDADAVMQINPVWSMMRHTGEDVMKETRRRWYRFCSRPRRQDSIEPFVPYDEDDPLGESDKHGSMAMVDAVPWEESDREKLDEWTAAVMESGSFDCGRQSDPKPVARKRGRPVKRMEEVAVVDG